MKTPRGRAREGFTVEPNDATIVPLTIESPAGQQNNGTKLFELVRDPNQSNVNGDPNILEINYKGGIDLFPSSGIAGEIRLTDGDIAESVQFSGRFIAVIADLVNTDEPEAVWVNHSGSGGALPDPTISFYKKGMLKFSGSAPADADINNGACFMFFDSTNGAAKVRWKGKTLNGTVVTGQVALV